MRYFALFLITLLTMMPVQARHAFGGGSPLGGGNGTSTSYNFITNLKVYPNPTSDGAVTVSFNNTDRKDMTIRVYNLLGKEILQKRVSGEDGFFETQISLGDFAKGVYILEVSNGVQTQTKRISYI